MIVCPACGGSTSVTETRTTGSNVRRRRRCGCGHRVTTIEVIVPAGSRRPLEDMVLIKRVDLESISLVARRALGEAMPVEVASEPVALDVPPEGAAP